MNTSTEHTQAAPPEPPPRTGGRRAVAHTLVLARRHLLHLVRAPGLALWLVVQPVLFLVLFNFMFGGVISREAGDYIDFVVPGVVVQFLLVTAFGVANGVGRGLAWAGRAQPRGGAVSGNHLGGPLTFVSSLFVPTQTLPGWLQAFVTVNR